MNAGRRLVGVCLDDARYFPKAIFGALKAGCGIVPLSTETPYLRMKHIVHACGISVVITDSSRMAIFESMNEIKEVILADAEDPMEGSLLDGSEFTGHEEENLDDVVYVIHTSGTTGTPKGIPITHRNLLPLLHWQDNVFVQGERLDSLLLLSLSFDFGIQDLLIALLFGGCLHTRRQRWFEPAADAAYIKEKGISSLYATPSMLEALLPHGPFPSVRIVLAGGETLSKDLGRRILDAAAPGARIFNGYGPTEASINCLMYRVTRESLERHPRALSVPVGRISGHNRVYVRDAWGRIVPIGVPGEIVIGGPGVSSGYIGRPEQTDMRFVTDDIGRGAAGATRLYRSGDRGRYLPGGDIEFLNRQDDQVKIRGYRVELAEIEAAISDLQGVGQATVVPEPGRETENLVAFAIRADPQAAEPEPTDLAEALALRLPGYMMPRRFFFVPAFPTTVNGKVDRRILKDWAAEYLARDHVQSARDAAAVRASPANRFYDVVEALWREELRLDHIDAEADFFELGGHSLVIAKLHTRLCKHLAMEIPIGALFEQRTLTALAAYLDGLAGRDAAGPGSDLAVLTEAAASRRSLGAAALHASRRTGR